MMSNNTSNLFTITALQNLPEFEGNTVKCDCGRKPKCSHKTSCAVKVWGENVGKIKDQLWQALCRDAMKKFSPKGSSTDDSHVKSGNSESSDEKSPPTSPIITSQRDTAAFSSQTKSNVPFTVDGASLIGSTREVAITSAVGDLGKRPLPPADNKIAQSRFTNEPSGGKSSQQVLSKMKDLLSTMNEECSRINRKIFKIGICADPVSRLSTAFTTAKISSIPKDLEKSFYKSNGVARNGSILIQEGLMQMHVFFRVDDDPLMPHSAESFVTQAENSLQKHLGLPEDGVGNISREATIYLYALSCYVSREIFESEEVKRWVR